MSDTFRVGVTLHSFTNEYCSFKWSFEDMMQKASLLGRGVEIVGPAHHRGFPEVTDEFERVFKSSVERNGLTPTSYGSYADPFMLPGRDLTEDELVAYTIPQLKGAAKLGFPVVRLQYFVHPVIERLLPYAEKYDLKTPHLGLIPDAGIFTRSIPKFRIEGARRNGVSEPLLKRAVELWAAKTPLQGAREQLKALGADDRTFSTMEIFWGSFGHSDPASVASIMPYIIHTHGKFFSIVSGDEPDVRFEEYVKALILGNYRGWMSSEYEGPDTNSFAVVSAHQEMVWRYIAKYSRQPV
jgi:sugar phosphate isomerase/epimerase